MLQNCVFALLLSFFRGEFNGSSAQSFNCAVDCIDCAAEESVVNAVNEGIRAARAIVPIRRPWIMISVNDDKDVHFRKAGNTSLA